MRVTITMACTERKQRNYNKAHSPQGNKVIRRAKNESC